MLSVKNLSFGYVKNQLIFEDVNFSINEGEFIAVGGRNGSGKTTITRLLVGLEQPHTGEIFYQGNTITKVPAAQRGRYIGYVFQKPDRQMFRNTVEEEIAFGPQQLGYSEEEVQQITADVMDRTGLNNVTEAYPLNLRRGVKQRIAIASALAMQSRILILDEPTSGQDGKETEELLELLVKLNREGISILLVTHDMDIIAGYCSRAIVMGQGKLAFDGTPKELFSKADEELYGLGLTKPHCVTLSQALPGMPYCPTMADFERAMLERLGGARHE